MPQRVADIVGFFAKYLVTLLDTLIKYQLLFEKDDYLIDSRRVFSPPTDDTNSFCFPLYV